MILKFAFRNLRKRPFLNLIKVTGLSLSFSGFLLIILFLKNELTFESFNKNAERVFRLTVYQQSPDEKHFARVYNPEFVPKMAEHFPGIVNYVRLAPVRGGIIRHEQESVFINQAFECDSTFFDIFPVELISGNPENILDAPGSMVISDSFAEKIFGQSDPLGQVLIIPAGQYYGRPMEYTIKGVMMDFPPNSHLHPEFVTSPVDRTIFNGWAYTYLLLSANAYPADIISGFKEFMATYFEINPDEMGSIAYLENIREIHLHSNKLREIESNSNLYIVYTLAIAALIILVTGLLNYSNLNLGMAGNSDTYLFISRVTGSSSLKAMNYFLTEALLIVSIGVCLGLVISGVGNLILLKYFSLDLFKTNILPVAGLTLSFWLAGILSGMLPVLKRSMDRSWTSGFKNKPLKGDKGLSKAIIVIQYVICTALIISVLVISRQTRFALESGMGYGNDNLICIRDVHSDAQKKFEVFKEELLKFNSIMSVSAMMEQPGGEANDVFAFSLEGYAPDQENKADNFIGVLPCDYSISKVFGLTLLSGNDFSPHNTDNNGSGEYLINETAMKRLNYTDPDKIVGKHFRLITNIPTIDLPEGMITGVLKDFHLSGIRKKIMPLVLFKKSDLWIGNILISFKPGMKDQAIINARNVWQNMFPGYPFQFEYVNSMYASVYRSEILQSTLLRIFTIISLFICSMGLLGMALLSTQKRTREIGLRKINGATSGEILSLLNSDLVKWIVVAVVIAIPISYYAMTRWMEAFAYKTELSWYVFAFAGIISISIALVTVSVQSWKEARRNPVESLRYE